MRIFIKLITTIICLLKSTITQEITHHQVIPEIGYLDYTQDPCDDFYKFTCGNFDKYHPIPFGASYINHFTILEDEIIHSGNRILKAKISPHDPQALKKVKAAYRACVNTELSDSDILDVPELRIVDDWNGMPLISNNHKTKFTWNDIGKMSATYGVPLLFNFMLYQQPENTDRYLVMITLDPLETAPNLIRPRYKKNYDEILEESFEKFAQRPNPFTNSQPFDNFVVNLAKRIVKIRNPDKCDSEIQNDLNKIADFWQSLSQGGIIEDASIIQPFSQVYPTLENLQNWTYQHFGDDIDIDWLEYFRSFLTIAGVKVDQNLITYPTTNRLIYGILNLVRQTDPDVIKNFALLRVFVFLAPDSDRITRDAFNHYLQLENYTIYPRWEYCTRKILDASDTASMDFAVAYDYQRYYFNKNQMFQAAHLIQTLQTTFEESLSKSNWMDKESREAALIKAKKMIAMIAYPDFVDHKHKLDKFYRNIRICNWDHYSNAQKLRAFKQAYSYSRLAKPRTRTFWDRSVFDTNAYYNRPDNRIIVPIAMLNPIYFNGIRLLDYSRLGDIIGHEIIHGFDSDGQKYNQDGLMTPWWTDETMKAFEQRKQCFIEQYNQYYIPEIDAYVNGTLSLNENLADNGGIRQAYRAFYRSVGDVELQSRVSWDQLFFISFATSWCSSETIAYMENYNEKYSPNRYRVNGPLANMKEFARAFHCPRGAKMNPKKKCILW